MLILLKVLHIFILAFNLWAAEESLDFSKLEAETPKSPSSSSEQKWNLMGRVDLTSEVSAPDKGKNSEHELSNRHFLVLFHAKPSQKTSFMGELVNQSFYFIDHKLRKNLNFQFGKIIVPFGDTRKYHHFYGGLSQLKSSSIMFPNVWAESGFNFSLLPSETESIDLYWVNSIQSTSDTTDPDLKATAEPRNAQAGGLRWTREFEKWTAILSVYRGEFQPGREIFIAGGDLFSEFGAFNLKDFRCSLGIANAWFKKAPVSGNFQQKGDYLELAYRNIRSEDDELRFRYGTFIHNSETQTQKDTHSFSLGYAFMFDVIKTLVEYQWNYEAITEKENDIAKAMLSVDF